MNQLLKIALHLVLLGTQCYFTWQIGELLVDGTERCWVHSLDIGSFLRSFFSLMKWRLITFGTASYGIITGYILTQDAINTYIAANPSVWNSALTQVLLHTARVGVDLYGTYQSTSIVLDTIRECYGHRPVSIFAYIKHVAAVGVLLWFVVKGVAHLPLFFAAANKYVAGR